jgi:hypothetical protein
MIAHEGPRTADLAQCGRPVDGDPGDSFAVIDAFERESEVDGIVTNIGATVQSRWLKQLTRGESVSWAQSARHGSWYASTGTCGYTRWTRVHCHHSI